ncbi:MAG TPA: threonine aldolase [Cytophagales bacterium]|nr:threonine aldolase [Cytophagales bacterium]HAA23354.1 threonine aldolase [Cytophagales bacterium]HAP65025.1 threonine aldolase [Cytophagales bacterium]
MTIDLRSDTVTKPTQAMQKVMWSAEVGDDVFGEDPTVNRLEKLAAEMFGTEAGLFCPSGTMTNQIAIRVQTQPQDEIICDWRSHIYNYEGGGIAANSLCSVKLVDAPRGIMTSELVEDHVRAEDIHHPSTRLVAVENTVNKGGGSCYPLEELQALRSLCDAHKLVYHLDGARLFNALVAKQQSPEIYGPLFDTISICLSKGLGAPVGSVLLGAQDTITRARRVRKVFGGGMRQAGYLAAAGIYALENHMDRLDEDHQRARALGNTLEECSWVHEVLAVDTNIVIAILEDPHTPTQALEDLKKKGILGVPFGKKEIRFVTHLDFSDEDLRKTQKALVELY